MAKSRGFNDIIGRANRLPGGDPRRQTMTSCPFGRPIVAVVVAGVLVCAADDGSAQAVSDFYRDKQMQIIVRSSPGGSYDLYSRLVATHMMNTSRAIRPSSRGT